MAAVTGAGRSPWPARDEASARTAWQLSYPGRPADRAGLTRVQILPAEDNEATAGLAERGLGDLDHVVTRVARGDDAAALDLDTPFDVAVLDRMLPGIYGVAVVAQSESLA